MPSHNVLLVEGRDDEAVIGVLLRHRGITNVQIEQKGGKNNILQEGLLLAQLARPDLNALDIMLDADDNLAGHWQSLCTILAKASYGYILPKDPDPNGTILKFTNPNGVPVGIWLMPNNQTSGKLEDFLAQLVPHGDLLWSYADTTIQRLPEQRFRATDRSKAHIHTWLAWQAEPGKPLGQAMTARYLTVGQPAADQFVFWIRQLFA